MGDYYGVSRSDEYLEHAWGVSKGGQRKNHKYIMRVKSGSGWRYLYTPAEVAAYGKEKISGAVSKAGRMASHFRKIGAKGTAGELARGAGKALSTVGKRVSAAGSYHVRRVVGLFENPRANRMSNKQKLYKTNSSDGADTNLRFGPITGTRYGKSPKAADRKARAKSRVEKLGGSSGVSSNKSNGSKQGIRSGSKGKAMSAAGDSSGKGKGTSKSLAARIKQAVTKSNDKVYGRKAGTISTAGTRRDQARKTASSRQDGTRPKPNARPGYRSSTEWGRVEEGRVVSKPGVELATVTRNKKKYSSRRYGR